MISFTRPLKTIESAPDRVLPSCFPVQYFQNLIGLTTTLETTKFTGRIGAPAPLRRLYLVLPSFWRWPYKVISITRPLKTTESARQIGWDVYRVLPSCFPAQCCQFFIRLTTTLETTKFTKRIGAPAPLRRSYLVLPSFPAVAIFPFNFLSLDQEHESGSHGDTFRPRSLFLLAALPSTKTHTGAVSKVFFFSPLIKNIR